MKKSWSAGLIFAFVVFIGVPLSAAVVDVIGSADRISHLSNAGLLALDKIIFGFAAYFFYKEKRKADEARIMELKTNQTVINNVTSAINGLTDAIERKNT